MDTIGFIGLGNMGASLADRLIGAGRRLMVFDLRADRAAELGSRGAVVADCARQVGENSRVVFACLPSREASLSVASEVAATRTLEVYVEMSTIGAETMSAVARMLDPDIATIDAPVSGGPRGAKAGTLSIMVAGSAEVIARIRPLLDLMGGKVFVVGHRPGLAQICKLVNNAISFTALTVSCEAIVLGVKAGLDAATLIDVINASTGRNAATIDRFPACVLPRTFNGGGLLGGVIKDIELYLAEADRLKLSAPSVRNTLEVWSKAVERLDPSQDFTNIVRYFEEHAGIEVKGRA